MEPLEFHDPGNFNPPHTGNDGQGGLSQDVPSLDPSTLPIPIAMSIIQEDSRRLRSVEDAVLKIGTVLDDTRMRLFGGEQSGTGELSRIRTDVNNIRQQMATKLDLETKLEEIDSAVQAQLREIREEIQDEADRVTALAGRVDKLEDAVFGDELTEAPGLEKRVETIEERNKKLVWMGVGAVAASGFLTGGGSISLESLIQFLHGLTTATGAVPPGVGR